MATTAYNANNQLTTWGTANLFYDANGNMISDGVHSYTWDARNQLKQIDSGTTASFAYDPLGRRVGKTILGTSTNFLFDLANPVQELSGTTPTANLLTGSLDEYFSRTDGVGARHFLTDALGSTVALTDSAGAAQTSYTSEPFGNLTIAGAPTTNSFTYTGRELDASSTYFYRARYYSSQFQRFLNSAAALGLGLDLYRIGTASCQDLPGVIGGVFGGIAGAEVGAIVGTFIEPGLGTWAGGMIGGALGGGFGQAAGDALFGRNCRLCH